MAVDKEQAGRWQLRPGERRLILIAGDLLMASLATLLALVLWSLPDWLEFGVEFIRLRAGWFVLIPLIWPLLMINLYDIRRAGSWPETVRGVFIAAGMGLIIYLGVYFFRFQPGSLPRRGPVYFLIFVIILTLAWRYVYVRVFTRPAFQRKVLIVGAGQSGKDIMQVLSGLNPSPFKIVGFVDDDPQKQGLVINGVRVLGDHSSLMDLLREHRVSDVIVAITGSMGGEMFQALLDAQERGVEIIRMPVLYEEILGRVPIRHLEADWILRSFVNEIRVSSLYLIMKRLMDIAGAMLGLMFLALVLPFVSLAILVESGRPIFFLQPRVGQSGKLFRLMKFRTMKPSSSNAEFTPYTVNGDPRTTRVGRILRMTHIDEFPQFINVLKGDMSLVGPRPEVPEMVERLEKEIPFYRARLLVKPGIGGWAQVNFGKGASLEGSAIKLEYDLYYIKHRSLLLDLWIILMSIGQAIGLRGV
jgi:exopolysaccharide biosynthesis polyprenyl glycosylphosphotransferase